MNPEAEKLYNLLPALYRIRDAEQGLPLQALCAVIAEEIAVLRENLDQLYDDQFIETCAEWVAPYIGDLIGYRPLHGVTARTVSARAEVANTIAYRRRKGTATVLEQLARDVTGWNARVAEFFQQLQTSQYMNHIRPANLATVDLRNWEALERRGTAFNTLAYSIDTRRIETQKGRYNIPNIGLFLWRLDVFSLTQSPAFRVDDQRFMFSPLGNDMQLFTRPGSETDIIQIATRMNVPEPISRRVLDHYFDDYYGDQKSFLVEYDAGGSLEPQVCNLSDDGAMWAHLPVPSGKFFIDPVLGRIAFPADPRPENVRVSFHSAFSMRMGGGEYERRQTYVLSGSPVSVIQGQILQAALSDASGGGIVEIGDSGRYEETLSTELDPDAKLELRAVNKNRPVLILGGPMEIKLESGAELTLNGLLIAGGQLRVSSLAETEENPPLLRLRHCTLVPGLALTHAGDPVAPNEASLVVEPSNGLTLEIDSCILGGLRTGREVTVKTSNSIVDAMAPEHIAFANSDETPGGILTLVNCTVIGKVHTARLDLASNVIFAADLDEGDLWTHPVISDQNQRGCTRFSFVPLNAIVPRRYHCQPDLAVSAAINAADVPKGSLDTVKRQQITSEVQARIRPAFTSLRYGKPGYCQLATYCPEEIRKGAEDESEMGAFHDVYAPQRESNLRIRLQEYLRFGLEAGIFYAT